MFERERRQSLLSRERVLLGSLSFKKKKKEMKTGILKYQQNKKLKNTLFESTVLVKNQYEHICSEQFPLETVSNA